MENKILPIGSVVTIKNGDGTKLMIVARASIINENGKEVYFDYCGVLLVEGLSSVEATYFFNKEQVGNLVFKGYESEEEIEFQNKYDEMMLNSKMEKGTIEN